MAAALARRRAARGTGLRQEVNELLRAGLAATDEPDPQGDDYHLPSFDPGRALLTDHRAWKELLDDEDVERGVRSAS